MDRTWTSRGRAGAAEIAWEARDGGARSKGMIRVDGTWTSRGRAGRALGFEVNKFCCRGVQKG